MIMSCYTENMHITSTGGLLKIIVLNDNFEINRIIARSHFKHREMNSSGGVKDDSIYHIVSYDITLYHTHPTPKPTKPNKALEAILPK